MPTSEPSWFLTIGDFFADRYEVCALVGRGTHGATFEARDKDTDNTVVLKVIHPDLMEGDTDENLFLLRRVLAYRSKQLVPVRDLVETETQIVLVQPYLSAPNLRMHLQLRSDNKEGFSALSCLRLLTDVASGLSWVHRFGPHGNIKPENIFVANEGCRLHDAYHLEGIQRLDWVPDNPWTKDAYQAPEQYGGEESATMAADTYAFALILGEALAGKPVKDGIRLSAQSSLVSSKEFDDLFVASTSRNPEDRPTMEEFVSEAGKTLSSAGEEEHGAKRDMNITLVTGIPTITESMAKDMASGLSAKEVLKREDERQVSDEEDVAEPERAVPDLSESELEEIEDASLIGGEPLSVGFGMIVGKAISTVLGQDIGFSDDEESLEDGGATSAELARQGTPPQTTTISKDDARAIVNAHGKNTSDTPPMLPIPQLIEDVTELEIIPLDATPRPDDEEAEVFAEADMGFGGHHDGEDLQQDTLKIETVELSSDSLTVEEVAPKVASQLEEQLTVQPLGDAKDLVASEPNRISKRERIRGAMDPTTLATEVTHRRDLRRSGAITTPVDKSSRAGHGAEDAPAGPWYLAVIAAGIVAFAAVWFLASPSEPPQEGASPAENATSADEAPQTTGAKAAPATADATEAAANSPDAASAGQGSVNSKEIPNSLASTENALATARELMNEQDKSAAEARSVALAAAAAKADAEALATAEEEARSQAEAEALAQAEAKAKAEAETQALAEAEALAAAEAEAKALAAAEAEAEALAAAEAEAEALAAAEAEALAAAEAEALAAADALALAEADAQLKADAEAKVQAELEARKPTPAAACRNGYIKIPGSEAKGAFCIQKLEYHGGEKRPLRRVKYDAAVKKCAMEFGRLCTAGEFGAACGDTYPYGSRFNRSKCNVMSSFFEPRPVRPGGTMAGCQSPHGVFDLSGNVDEWVEGALVAGGNSSQEGKSVACSRAVKRKPDRPTRSTGFRCCHDLN